MKNFGLSNIPLCEMREVDKKMRLIGAQLRLNEACDASSRIAIGRNFTLKNNPFYGG